MIDMAKLTALAIQYDAGDPRRVHHFLKVAAFCRLLGASEQLDAQTQNMLDAAAVLHDIGIHEAERRHGSSAGPWQEQEGPAVAAPLLREAGANEDECARVCWLIAHHHTYDASDDLAFRILVEADFLVNAYEDALPRAACETAQKRLFRTPSGCETLRQLYLAPPYTPN